MTEVQTVRGPVDGGALGVTLMHEHVFVLNADFLNNDPTWDEAARVADAVAKLRGLREIGVDTIVDPTCIGLGRYLPRIQKIATEVDLQIVAATGIYTYGDLPFYFHYRIEALTGLDHDPMVDYFVRDITEGIAGTGVRAGIIKCATEEHGLTEGVERVLRAAARAHRQTGAPITTHTHAGTKRGLDQQRVFLEEGVDLSQVVIGHSGDTTDLDYLAQLMDAGSTIGMDRFGVDVICPFEDRVDTVAQLCAKGYADRMVLAHDAACFIDWFDPDLTGAREMLMPNWHYRHIHDDVLPALRERGVSEDQLTTMLVEAPRRILEPVAPY
jgi:phosphotriesterase-related protein